MKNLNELPLEQNNVSSEELKRINEIKKLSLEEFFELEEIEIEKYIDIYGIVFKDKNISMYSKVEIDWFKTNFKKIILINSQHLFENGFRNKFMTGNSILDGNELIDDNFEALGIYPNRNIDNVLEKNV